MVLCKFFQQGHCRYGKSCRFEHEYASKYTYHANAPQQNLHASPPTFSDEQLTAQSVADSTSLLNGSQWLLSSYKPFNEKPLFPGFVNLSPEEARLFIYESKANNTLDKAVTHLNELTQDAKSKYEALTRPSQQIIQVFRSLYNGEAVSSPFTSNTANSNPFGVSGANNAASIFKSAAQGSAFGNSQSSIFGQNASFQASTPFAQVAQPNQAQSIFAQAASQNVFQQNQPVVANPASIFASANQNAFQTPPPTNQNAFQTPATTNQNFFQTPAPTNQGSSIFGNWAQNQNQPTAFPNQAQSIFAQAKQETNVSAPTNVFAQANQPQQPFQSGPTASVFGQSSSFGTQPTDDIGAYSQMEDLALEDVEMYMSTDFKLGFVPEMPPPKTLCM